MEQESEGVNNEDASLDSPQATQEVQISPKLKEEGEEIIVKEEKISENISSLQNNQEDEGGETEKEN